MFMKSKSLSKAMAIGAACLALNSGISNNFTSFSNVAVAAGPVQNPPADQPSNWGKWWTYLIVGASSLLIGGIGGFIGAKCL